VALVSFPKSLVREALFFSLAAAGSLCACSEGKQPDLLVQVCLRDDHGVSAFKSTLQSIAAREQMHYIDSSDAVAKDLKTVGATGDRMHIQNGLVHVSVEGGNGIGLSATNVGLNLYEVAVGFSDGPQLNESARFSGSVVKELSQQWQVKTVPAGSGALPDVNCAASAPSIVAPPNTSLERTRER
jgi:hypothetical protein